MLFNIDWTGLSLVLLVLVPWTVRLLLGLVAVLRARKEDLPKIVNGLTGWLGGRGRR